MGKGKGEEIDPSELTNVIQVALVDSRGRISLPARAREILDIKPGDPIVVMIEGNRMILVPAGE